MIVWALGVIGRLLAERQAREHDALGQALWEWSCRAISAWHAYVWGNDVAAAQARFDEATDRLQLDVLIALAHARQPEQVAS